MSFEGPKISILLCCYNRENFIAESIESILNQSYQNFELLITDDCSTDNSVNIIKQYNDDRISFYQNKKNIGVIKTRNNQIKMAKCDYIAFHDSDDVWLNTKLEKQIKYMVDNPNCAATFTSAELIDENSKLHTDQTNCDMGLDTFNQHICKNDEIIHYFFYNGNFLSHPSALIKKDIFNKLGYFNEILFQLHDFDYWCKLANRYEIYVFDEILMQVRRISNTHTGVSGGHESLTKASFEYINIIYNFISDMTKDKFISSFRNEIIFEPQTEEELICEKYFILLQWKHMGVPNKLIAFLYFSNNYNKKLEKILLSKYNYPINKYSDETGKVISLYPNDYYSEYKRYKNEYELSANHAKNLENIITANENTINLLNQKINDITSSKSWKLTSPIRKVSKLFKK